MTSASGSWLPETTVMTNPTPEVERQLVLAFAPLDKRALGLAFGAAFALLMAGATSIALVLDPEGKFPLSLLGRYFYGYMATPPGILIGAAWGFVTGFFWGWFAAFARNFVLAVWLMTLRIRSDLDNSRDFLDHI